MFTVALTGGIGCGKTTVCKLFSQHNIPVIDTDIIARELVEPGQTALIEIVSFFGNSILFKDGSLDRKSLAGKIFQNQKNRNILESILHPKIRNRVNEKIKSLSSTYVVIAIPLLIETSQYTEYDRILVVDCDEEQQIKRTLNRDQRSLDEIKSIINTQASQKQRLDIADDVIDNRLDTTHLDAQISNLHQQYLELAAHQ